MSEKPKLRISSAGDPNKDAPSVSGPAKPVVRESPPPPRADPIAVIRNRLRELVTARDARATELERRVKLELAGYDSAIAELNNLLVQMGQQSFVEQPRPIQTPAGVPKPQYAPQLVGQPGSVANIRQMAQQHPMSGQNILRRRAGGSE